MADSHADLVRVLHVANLIAAEGCTTAEAARAARRHDDAARRMRQHDLDVLLAERRTELLELHELEWGGEPVCRAQYLRALARRRRLVARLEDELAGLVERVEDDKEAA